nr:uncharacterized protein LOC127329245 [Lolium perenne]
MVKKKNPTLVTSAVSSGAAARAPPNLPRRSVSDAPPPAPAPPAPSSSAAGPTPGDWPASTTTKRDEKRARSLGIISSDEGNVILPGSHTEGNASPKDDNPMNPEAFSINPQFSADDISDTAGSMHDDDADRAAFVDAAAEKAEAPPSKRSSGGFADEDDLYDFDEGFIEPPAKKAKSGTITPNPAASEASAPAAAPVAQISTASSLSKGKDVSLTATATNSPPGKPVIFSCFNDTPMRDNFLD